MSADVSGNWCASFMPMIWCWLELLERLCCAAGHFATIIATQHRGRNQASCLCPAQAIVFSQFWMHLQLIAATLTAGGVSFAMLQAHLKPDAKAAALQRFQDDPACSELLNP